MNHHLFTHAMKHLRRTTGLYPTSSNGDFEQLLSEEPKASDDRSEEGLEKPALAPTLPWVRWCITFLALFIYSVVLVTFARLKPSDIACAEQLSLWSPLNEAIEYQEGSIENSFAHQTKYRGPPTPELEEAWDRLWHVGVVGFPEEKLSEVNASSTLSDGRHLQPFPQSEDNETLSAQFLVFHDIHCLNMIRQYTWRDWYLRHNDTVKTPIDILDSEVGARMHADHCIESLRLSLMCHGDTTPLFTILDPEAPLGARADFSPHRKCRNFDRLHTWAVENHAFDAWFKFDPEKNEA